MTDDSDADVRPACAMTHGATRPCLPATLDTAFEGAIRLPLVRLIYAEVCEAGDRLRGLTSEFERHPQLRSFALDVIELHARLERLGIQAIEHVAKEDSNA